MLGGQLGHLMVSPKPNGLFLAPWDDPSQMTLADDGYARDQLQITELSLQYPLTDDDRRFLESVLPHLPPLHYPMSEAGAKDFLDAWCSLPNRPEWEPVWVTAASIERRKAEQDAAMRRHLQALEGDFAQGLLAAVNSERIEVVALSRSCLIPRREQGLLTSIGMVFGIAIRKPATTPLAPKPLDPNSARKCRIASKVPWATQSLALSSGSSLFTTMNSWKRTASKIPRCKR
ncbi:hypothetical protein AAFM48_08080 [Burkholderia pseudomallei]